MFEAYANNPNVRAFLDVLAYCEGANYNTLYGGGTFSGNQHPCRTISAGRYTSTAAGRYQFLCSTWRSLQTKYGFSDFSPTNQDLGAIALISQAGGLNALVAGDFTATVNAAKGTWPSLPGGSQQTRSWPEATSYFQSDLAAQGGSVQQPAADGAIDELNFFGLPDWLGQVNTSGGNGGPTSPPASEQGIFSGPVGIIAVVIAAAILVSIISD